MKQGDAKTALLFLVLLLIPCVLAEAAKSANTDIPNEGNYPHEQVRFDVSRTRQRFEGFGTQIWAFNNNPRVDLHQKLKQLNIKFVRLTRQGASWQQMASVRDITDRLGIQRVYTVWSAPGYFTDSKGMLQDVPEFTQWWVEEVESLVRHQMKPHYIELMNEPDSKGQWSTGISPPTYNALVKAVRKALDSSGLADVGLLGPGLSHLDWKNHTSTWIRSLDREAVDSLAVWSTHSWDDGDLCRGGASCIERQWSEFGRAATGKDPNKPVFVTEYATKEATFHGTKYPHPEKGTQSFFNGSGESYYSATDTVPFAVRLYENTLALLNSGASVPFIWQLVDETSEVVRIRKSWGLVDLNGSAKPAFESLETLCPRIPPGARVIAPSDQSTNSLYAAAFVEGEKIVVAIANDSREEHRSKIYVSRAGPGWDIDEAIAFQLGESGDPAVGEPDIGKTSHVQLNLTSDDPGEFSFDVSLPADSTLTVVLEKRAQGFVLDRAADTGAGVSY